jgi:hypothetical protein
MTGTVAVAAQPRTARALMSFGSCRQVSLPVLGAKSTRHRRGACTAAATIGVAALALAAAATLAFVHFRERPSTVEPVRFQIQPPDETAVANAVVLSPDGRRMAFDAPGPDGRIVLWVRSLDALDARPLPGTEGVAPGPFWSPDSQSLAFGVNGFPGRLKKVDLSGDHLSRCASTRVDFARVPGTARASFFLALRGAGSGKYPKPAALHRL